MLLWLRSTMQRVARFPRAARSYLTETGTKKKALFRKALAGDGRTKVEGWLPRYMAYPQQRYTKRPAIAGHRCRA